MVATPSMVVACTLWAMMAAVASSSDRGAAPSCAAMSAISLGANVSVLNASQSIATAYNRSRTVPYCLVKVLVQPTINIWVGLPMGGSYNGRLQALGGSGYAGSIQERDLYTAVWSGYIGAFTDTGHIDPVAEYGPHSVEAGAFGMVRPGVPNTQLQIDYAYRSERMMGVVSKQLATAFYGKPPEYSYWNGCSTGGRQGLMLAQRYPDDYDGIIAGSSAIHFDKFKAFNIWPHVAMLAENGETVAASKLIAVDNASIVACDGLDGVVDKMLRDPRACKYDARMLLCKPDTLNTSACLTSNEARAVNKMWDGARNEKGDLLWYGLQHGAKLAGGVPPGLATGDTPVLGAIAQGKYWVYLNPDWDWRTLNYSTFERFFYDTVRAVGPLLATDDADLAAFRDRGNKLLMYHGWADELIMPQGSVDYYDEVVRTVGYGDVKEVQKFARLFMVPGMGHCGGGQLSLVRDDPDSEYLSPMESLAAWVENGSAPDRLIAQQKPENPNQKRHHRVKPGSPDGTVYNVTRPLCPHPAVRFPRVCRPLVSFKLLPCASMQVAVYKGTGSTNEESNFVCGDNVVGDSENANRATNERLFGQPFFRPTAALA